MMKILTEIEKRSLNLIDKLIAGHNVINLSRGSTKDKPFASEGKTNLENCLRTGVMNDVSTEIFFKFTPHVFVM